MKMEKEEKAVRRLTGRHESDDLMLQASLSTEDTEIKGETEGLPVALEHITACRDVFIPFGDCFGDCREGGLPRGRRDIRLVILVKIFHFLIPSFILSSTP